MKTTNALVFRRLVMKLAGGCFGILLAVSSQSLLGAPVGSDAAAAAVRGWLKADTRPLGKPLNAVIKRVETFNDQAGESLYHVVYLDPAGFAIVAADDLAEPVVGFASQGHFDPSEDNPLGALVSNDLPGRVAKVRSAAASPLDQAAAGAKAKWERLQRIDREPARVELGISAVSDMRVAPFVQTRWNQEAVSGSACFNYYTPPYSAGNVNNYPCGCVATAMSQLMRYWQYPTRGVGAGVFTIYVDDALTTRQLRGGDGAGGPYAWANMALVPNSPSEAQCQAIGALTADAGVAVNMDYEWYGSGADTLQAKDAFVGTFEYGNAVKGYDGDSTIGSGLNGMVNPNLDARYPILFGINGSIGGHAIVCDGYGYNFSTLYHHLNLGWSGTEDAWYALPTIDTILGTFTSVYKCVYNVYVSGSGEIISGRIVDSSGTPVANATVTASRTGGGTYTASSDSNGIYALAKIPGASQYSVSATKAGYSPSTANFSTGTSSDMGAASGNYWGANFVLSTQTGAPIVTAQPANQSVSIGSSATFSVTASGTAPLSYFWRRNGSPIAGATSSSYTTNNVQLSDSGSQFSCLVSNTYGTALSSNAVLTVLSGDQGTILSEDFEGAFTGWAVGDTNTDGPITYWSRVNWQFGSVGAHSGSFMGYCAGQGYSGTTTAPQYQCYMDAYMSRSIDFTGYSGATLAFWYAIPTIEGCCDRALVYIDNTLVWSSAAPTASWQKATINLSGYLGGAHTLKFSFHSDDSVTYEGWYLDDILVTGTRTAPCIVTQPQSQTAAPGDSVTFNVSATGTAPLSYFWRRNGSPVAGATGSSYTTNNLQVSDSGSLFSCLVSNAYGTATSSNALLTVTAPSPITWAVSATASSEYSPTDYGAIQTVGQPNVTSCGDDSAAWAPLDDGTAPEWLRVSFGTQSPAVGVQVHETCNAPFVYQVDLIDSGGTNHTVWSGVDTTPCPGWLVVNFPATSYLVAGAKIYTQASGWEEIDAVGLLASSASPPSLGSSQLSGGQFTFNSVGARGSVQEIQASTNLVDWTVLGTLTNSTGTATYTDSATNLVRRFYRAKLVQ